MRDRFRITMPAVEIGREDLRMVLSGRKCWEVRRSRIPLCEPVALVVDGVVEAFAEFRLAILSTPRDVLGDILRHVGGREELAGAGVDRWRVFDIARGGDVYAHAYAGVAPVLGLLVRAKPERGKATLSSATEALLVWHRRGVCDLHCGETPLLRALEGKWGAK